MFSAGKNVQTKQEFVEYKVSSAAYANWRNFTTDALNRTTQRVVSVVNLDDRLAVVYEDI